MPTTPPTGTNLPAPPLPGSQPQPTTPLKPPGWHFVFGSLLGSFLNQGVSADNLDNVISACERAANRITKDYGDISAFLPKNPSPWNK